MVALSLITRNPQETRRLGQALGEAAQAGDAFLLIGGLGSGKTCLAQGVALGLGVAQTVASPTFILVREYRGRLPFYHIDLYRLENPKEVVALGLEAYLYGDGVCAVEWAERGLSSLPSENLTLRLAYLSPKRRRVRLEPRGSRYEELALHLRGQGWGG